MPQPKPEAGESHDEWSDRCMTDSVMVDEYPDGGQRFAVCENIWESDNAAASAAAPTEVMTMPETKPVTLSIMQAMADPAVQIDDQNHIIRNISVMQIGPALGHGWEVDETLLHQVADAINDLPKGTKSHLTHPGLTECGGMDGIQVMLGRVKDARVEGDKVRADLYMGRFASKNPQGDLRQYVEAIAIEDPQLIGTSIRFRPTEFVSEIVDDDGPEREESQEQTGKYVANYARTDNCLSADLVGDPAANRDGLLARLPARVLNGISQDLISQWIGTIVDADDSNDDHAAAAAAAATPQPSQEVNTMPEPKPSDQAADQQTATVDQQTAADPTPEQLQADLAAAEQTRQEEIRALAEQQDLGAEWALEHITAQHTVDQAKDDALQQLAAARGPVRISGGADLNRGTLRPAIVDAILLRAGRDQYQTEQRAGRRIVLRESDGRARLAAPHERANQFRGLSIVQMARVYWRNLGADDVDMLSNTQVVELFGPRRFHQRYPHIQLAQGTDDFDSILADGQAKSLAAAYLDAPANWQMWVKPGTAPDFKTIRRAALSEAPTLTSRAEGGPLVYVTLSDRGETCTLQEEAGGLMITRQAMINDDLDAFNRIPQLHANAARRVEQDVVYAILTTNGAMSDGNNLFDATNHGNQDATGAAPSVAEVGAGETRMMKQQGPKSASYLALVPKFLIVPVALKTTSEQLISSLVDPSKSNAATNPYHNKLGIVAEPRLDATSATGWYLVADFRDGQIDTIELIFLEGEQEPVLATETDFDTDDHKAKCRHTVVAKALDWRGLDYNPGT